MRLRGSSTFVDRILTTIPVCNLPFSKPFPCPQCGLVFFSYAIITKDSAKLFVGQSCLNADALKTLEDEKVEVLPYEGFFETLSSLQLCTGEEVCLSDPYRATFDVPAEGTTRRQGKPRHRECDREGLYDPLHCARITDLCIGKGTL